MPKRQCSTVLKSSQTKIKTFEIELTANCNAECPICMRTVRGMPKNGNTTLTLENIKRIFPDNMPLDNIDIAMVGVLGDPIVNPECLDICKYLSSIGANVSLSTNGGYRTEAWWKELAAIPRMFVGWAVDGFSSTNHIYRVNVNWKLVERNMRAYCSAGGEGAWKYIVFDHNEHEVEQAKNLATELGLSFRVRSGGRNMMEQKHKPRKHKEVTIKASDKYIELRDQTEVHTIRNSIDSNDLEKLHEATTTISCRHLNEGYAYIGSNMTLWPCCYTYSSWIDGDSSYYYNVDKHWNSLEHFPIEEILSHKNFTEIQGMWSPHHERFIPQCLKSCGANGAFLDFEKILD